MARIRHTYLGNYPANKETDWTDALQGVAHDDQHWYFTQKTKVFKFHVTQKLTISFKNAIAMARMPLELSARGGNHFGDPDFVKFRGRGFLLIPLEGKGGSEIGRNPRLVVYSTDGGLSYIGETRLPKQTTAVKTNRAGWFAVHPRTRVLY